MNIQTKKQKPISDICEITFVDEIKVKRISRRMKSNAAVSLLAETFTLLGDPNRIRIVFALSHEELCVCDIANLLKMSQSAVSHSLRTLRQMKLVRCRKEGKIAYYTLDGLITSRTSWTKVSPRRGVITLKFI